MSTFVIVNWFACLLTDTLLFTAIWKRKFLLIKPSIVVILFFHFVIQWAATLEAKYIHSFLPDPVSYALLVHGFPLVGLYISLITGSKSAKIVWERVITLQDVPSEPRSRAIFILAGIVVLITIFYLSYVPFSETGLFVIFTDPANSTMAREYSLKLLDNQLLKYLYAFMRSAFAPLLILLLSLSLTQCLKRRRFIQSLFLILSMAGVLIVVSLAGERSLVASLLLAILFAFLLRKGFPINPLFIVTGIFIVLIMPTLLTLLREGKEITFSNFWEYLTTSTFRRVFYGPMLTGLWYTHFAQTVGFFGIKGISKLAMLFNVSSINVPNLIGLRYGTAVAYSVSANTCYVFSYYSCFGLVSIVFSLIGLWMLDFSLVVYKRLSDTLLIPCISSIFISSISFASSDYTTVLLSHGFVVILMIVLILDHMCSKPYKPEKIQLYGRW